MELNTFQKLFSALKNTDMHYYLQKDPLLIEKMKEIFDYIEKYESLPTKKVMFTFCDKSMIGWIHDLKELKIVQENSNDLIDQFIHFIDSYKIKVSGEALWYLKYQDFMAFLEKNKRLPGVEESAFFDGTDMRKWYYTQKYRLEGKTNCKNFLEKQVLLLKQMECFIENGFCNEKLSDFAKLKELKNLIFTLERFPKKLESYLFSDQSSVFEYIKDIQNGKIILSEKEKMFYRKLIEFTVRIKKDGKRGVIKYENKKYEIHKKVKGKSFKASQFKNRIETKRKKVLMYPMSEYSYMAYFKEIVGFSYEEMSALFSIGGTNFKKIENKNYSLSLNIVRMFQFVVILENTKEKDAVLDKMLDSFKEKLGNENRFNYLLNKLCAYFSLYKGQNRPLVFSFYKKFSLEGKQFIDAVNLKRQLEIYKSLEEILLSVSINEREKELVILLQEQIKENLLNDSHLSLLLFKVNICLDSAIVPKSIYELGIEEAGAILDKLEILKLNNDLASYQLDLINECSTWLTYVIHPGENLSFEIFRLMKKLSMTVLEFEKLFNVYKASFYYKDTISPIIKEKIKNSLFVLDSYENEEAILRFKSCFLNSESFKLEKQL